jgi:hypothetical protein
VGRLRLSSIRDEITGVRRVGCGLVTMKGPNNSHDQYKQISAALLSDVQTLLSDVFTQSELARDLGTVSRRLSEEGLGFLTVSLPKLGKWLDKSLADGRITESPMTVGFSPASDVLYPKFLGALFGCVFDKSGSVLTDTHAVKCVRHLRQYLYLFYKLELPFAPEIEREVLIQFEKTDEELRYWNNIFAEVGKMFDHTYTIRAEQRRLEIALADACRLQDLFLRMMDKATFDIWLLTRSYDKDVDCSDAASTSRPRRSVGMDVDKQVLNLRTELTDTAKKIASLRGQLRWLSIIRKARILLHELFRRFDPKDIVPSHGPGAVSTKETLWEKWKWTHIPDRLSHVWPIDEYFYVSQTHVCDRLQSIMSLGDQEFPARVILVPKDSRGPRLISCEPLVNQWIQQGVMRAIVQLVESHPLTRYEVYFTDQTPNQRGALLGSSSRRYATLDLAEASDRVSLGLVNLLFPEPLLGALNAARSQVTQLPSGKQIKLQKHAPMGSALCFPIMACSIWALLSAGFTDAAEFKQLLNRMRKHANIKLEELCLVYGDDVIVPREKSPDAIAILESFGLRVNRSKSCTGEGFFRESCGMDAFYGTPVTPVRIRTAWTASPSPEPYQSYCEYASALYNRGYHNTHDVIVKRLYHTYGPLADAAWELPCPSVVGLPEEYRSRKQRSNYDLQKLERRVLCAIPRVIHHPIDGWMMLLRYLTNKVSGPYPGPIKGNPLVMESWSHTNDKPRRSGVWGLLSNGSTVESPFSAQSYTKRKAEVLAWRWR